MRRAVTMAPSISARFADGQLRHIERVTQDEPERRYHGLASFRWFDSPSYMFGDPDEAAHGNPDDEQ